MNLRPSGYEPDELPGCSTPRWCGGATARRPGVVTGSGLGGLLVDLAATYSPTSWDAVPWALRGFTAEFGMGSGGAPALSATRSNNHPTQPAAAWGPRPAAARQRRRRGTRAAQVRGVCRQAWHGGLVRCGCRCWGSRSIERLGPVSCVRRRTSTPGLSTWWSTTALMARPGFAVGFPLRCVQRLSCPNLATRLRGWRHDRSTRGSSTPVLSY